MYYYCSHLFVESYYIVIFAPSIRPKWHPNPQSYVRINISTPINSILALRFKSFNHSFFLLAAASLLFNRRFTPLVPSRVLWGVWTAWLDWCNNVTKSSCETNVYSSSMYLESVFWLYCPQTCVRKRQYWSLNWIVHHIAIAAGSSIKTWTLTKAMCQWTMGYNSGSKPTCHFECCNVNIG